VHKHTCLVFVQPTRASRALGISPNPNLNSPNNPTQPNLSPNPATQQIEPNNQLCTQGLQKTVARIREASSQEVDMERAAHGMADPEVQAILSVRIAKRKR
jgi:hypothetical protein